MKTNREYRELAWNRLWAGRWFWRLLAGGTLLGICGYVANLLISATLVGLGVEDWESYYLARLLNRCGEVTTPIPILTRDYVIRATCASALRMFIGYIMSAIACYGEAVILLRCLRQEPRGWFKAAFGGFKDPFGMLWLFFRLMLIYLWWSLLALIPVAAIVRLCLPMIMARMETAPQVASMLMTAMVTLGLSIWIILVMIPFYRYRFTFLIKAEHPDWRAGECLGECKRLMAGHKLASFRLDCSYWKPITLVLLLVMAVVIAFGLIVIAHEHLLVVALAALFVLAMIPAIVIGCFVVGGYIGFGQGLFYQELKGRGAVWATP